MYEKSQMEHSPEFTINLKLNKVLNVYKISNRTKSCIFSKSQTELDLYPEFTSNLK